MTASDDELTTTALLDELRMALAAPDLAFTVPPARLSGGFWADLFVLHLDASRGDLPATVVARITPDPILAAGETIVQRSVAEQGFATPAIHLAGGPDGPLGRCWSIMDLAAGAPLLSGMSGVGIVANIPHLFRHLPDQLATVSTSLHRLDAEPIRAQLDDLDGRVVDSDDLIVVLADRAGRAQDPLLIGAVDALRHSAPTPTGTAVCHGDLHPLNVLADGDRLTLLDWTSALIADPHYDVAFTALILSSPPLDLPSWISAAVTRLSRRLSIRFLRAYEQHAGSTLDADTLEWFTTFHLTRILCEAASWDFPDAVDRRLDHPWRSMAPIFRRRLELSDHVSAQR